MEKSPKKPLGNASTGQKTNAKQDIRNWFGGAKKTENKAEVKKEKRPIKAIDLTEDDGLVNKKQKVENGAGKAGPVTKPVPDRAPKRSKLPARQTPSKVAAKKRASLVESESSDSDDEALHAVSEDEDIAIVIDSDSEVEVLPAKNVRKPAAQPAPTQTNKAETQANKAPPKSKKAAKPELAADVKAAMAAVDGAAKKLPKIEPDLMAMEAGTGGADTEPPNAGSKDVPRGHPECLRDKTFVITGVLDSLWRNEAEDLIKRHGGRVTSAVSGKTSFLLWGEQAGKSKAAAAVAKGTKIITEDGLLSLIKAAPEPEAAAGPMNTSAENVQPRSAGTMSKGGGKTEVQATATTAAEELNRPPGFKRMMASKPVASAGPRPSSSRKPDSNGQLWVEKYRPKSGEELVGNPGAIATLRQWLRNWESINLRKEEPFAMNKGRGGKTLDLKKKAVLLSGPPGIGKTTSAMIVTRELGYLPVEVNASDTRNKADTKLSGGIAGKLANSIRELATNTAIGKDASGRKKRICLIMDEVDGMSGGDRGGVGELINTIKGSKLPIICICNDKYNQKLRSLRNSTLELDFRKPTADQIVKRVAGICQKEGLQVTDSTLRTVAEGANGDIRLVMGQLQMIRLRARSLSYDDAKGKMGTTKDADMSPFEAARKLLSPETARMSLMDRTELVFQDMDLVPLLIQENYLNHRPSLTGPDEVKRMAVIAKAAEAFSLGDTVNRSVRQYQNWGLMPFAATIGSVLPATFMRGTREVFNPYESNFPRFTQWLGQNSSFGKQKRLLGELHCRISASGACSTDRTGLRADYLPVFRKTLVKPLIDQQKAGIDVVVGSMQEYCMNKDDHAFILDITQFKQKDLPWNEDLYKSVPTQVKSAFTRQLNQSIAHQRPKSNIMVEEFKEKRGRKAAAMDQEQEGDGLGGDPELEAAAADAQKAEDEQNGAQEEDEDDELSHKDAAALARKQKTLAKRGIVFETKVSSAKGKKAAAGRAGAAGRGSGAAGGRGRGRGAKSK